LKIPRFHASFSARAVGARTLPRFATLPILRRADAGEERQRGQMTRDKKSSPFS
jgi:hypothetical protein